MWPLLSEQGPTGVSSCSKYLSCHYSAALPACERGHSVPSRLMAQRMSECSTRSQPAGIRRRVYECGSGHGSSLEALLIRLSHAHHESQVWPELDSDVGNVSDLISLPAGRTDDSH
jgi:hypothetical protein